MSKAKKGDWDEVFPEEMLRDLDEMVRNEPPVTPKLPARPASAPLSSARPGSAAPPPATRPASMPPPEPQGDSQSRRRAQELATRAANTPDSKKAGKLARQALELDRYCVDALVVLAHARATAPDELAEYLETAVRRGEQGLGTSYVEHYRGKFGSRPEARPYLRARRELADLFRDMGRLEKAIGHYEALLELDPADGLRVRDSLLGCYLAKGYLEGAQRVLAAFAIDTGATLAWARVMERYLAEDLGGAAAALSKARQSNAPAEDYLLGKKPMPQFTPSTFERGGEYEAIYCAANLLPALVQHPRFSAWLAKQAGG